MKGATTEPCEATRMTAKDTRTIAKGRSQYFFLAYAYLKISLSIRIAFIRFVLELVFIDN